MNHSHSWYVAVDDLTAGPATTELVIRGIEHRKVPPEALVCPVGARRWEPLASVAEFHAAVIRSYPPPPPESEESRRWLAQGFQFPAPAMLPRFEYPLDDEEQAEPLAAEEIEPEAEEVEPEAEEAEPEEEQAEPEAEEAEPEEEEAEPEEEQVEPLAALEVEPEEEQAEALAALEAGPASGEETRQDADLDVDWEEAAAASHIDWRDPFESFFLVGNEVELPEERTLLQSLRAASRDTFREESALWNLALCLAYGSDELGTAAAQAFFDAVEDQGAADRLDWMSRTLLGSGFVSSGIPQEAGQRGVRRLRSSCPPSLTGRLAS